MGKSKTFDYVMYDTKSIDQQHEFKEIFSTLEEMTEKLGAGRAQSLVKTKLEEAYMWVGKAIRDNQIQRNGSAVLQEQRKDG